MLVIFGIGSTAAVFAVARAAAIRRFERDLRLLMLDDERRSLRVPPTYDW